MSLLNFAADRFSVFRALIVGTSMGDGGGRWRALGFSCVFSVCRVRREVVAELWRRMAARRRVWRGLRTVSWDAMVKDVGLLRRWGGYLLQV